MANACSIYEGDVLKTARGRVSLNLARQMAMYIGRRHYGISLAEIARYFGLTHYPRNGSWTPPGVRAERCLARHNEAE